jgi:hypothetical protein
MAMHLSPIERESDWASSKPKSWHRPMTKPAFDHKAVRPRGPFFERSGTSRVVSGELFDFATPNELCSELPSEAVFLPQYQFSNLTLLGAAVEGNTEYFVSV